MGETAERFTSVKKLKKNKQNNNNKEICNCKRVEKVRQFR